MLKLYTYTRFIRTLVLHFSCDFKIHYLTTYLNKTHKYSFIYILVIFIVLENSGRILEKIDE